MNKAIYEGMMLAAIDDRMKTVAEKVEVIHQITGVPKGTIEHDMTYDGGTGMNWFKSMHMARQAGIVR